MRGERGKKEKKRRTLLVEPERKRMADSSRRTAIVRSVCIPCANSASHQTVTPSPEDVNTSALELIDLPRDKRRLLTRSRRHCDLFSVILVGRDGWN